MMSMESNKTADRVDEEVTLAELAAALRVEWRLLASGSLGAGLLALGITFIIPPTFTAKAVFLPPQQQQSLAAAAISSLGALSGLAGSIAGLQTPSDQYVGMMQSNTVADHIIHKFGLMKVYAVDYRFDAEQELAKKTDISVGKKDGLITVEVDDHDAQRAADMANQYIEELRAMTDTLAVSEAQQRRKFFEQRLAETKQALIASQTALQSSGVSGGTIKTDPVAAAEAYAELREQLTAAEVRLDTMRRTLSDNAAEVQQQQALAASLERQIKALSESEPVAGQPDYVSKFREFKYQEALFEIYARQYEMARADEAREGALIQVVDKAVPPELKSKPKRALTAVLVTLLSFFVLSGVVLVRRRARRAAGAVRT